MAQMNATVGDFEGNVRGITKFIRMAEEGGADIVAFPELAITGYPPQDLLLERAFVRRNYEALRRIMKRHHKIVAVVGFVEERGEKLYNAAAVFRGKELLGIARKALLPTYDVFDEARYFRGADEKEIKPIAVSIRERKINLGVEICEDLWNKRDELAVTELLAKRGADIVINISASPFYVGKRFEREKLLYNHSRKNCVPIFYVNMVGGQDELVFDGQSLAMDRFGHIIGIGKQFEEDLIFTDIDVDKGTAKRVEPPLYRREEEMFGALVLGIRDYFRKTGFKKAVVGLSGGIDSSLTACIAVEALGKENVIGVSMPSKYSSDHGKEDAQKLAENLGILFIRIPIQEVVDSYKMVMEESLARIRERFGLKKGEEDAVADENIQSRVRANCLMDISNRFRKLGILVINTGNKTELALGYCTLYGDMASGIGALGDVSKLEVYKLAAYVNERAQREVIPARVFSKRPSPELREGHFTPFNFEIVSPIVDEIMSGKSRREILRMGYPKKIVDDVYERFRKAEFKRRQAAPFIKITRRAFGMGWKMPIANKYDG